MTAASYTTDLTDWITDGDTTAWTELTNALSGGAPDETDTESALQGTNTVSQATNTTSLCSMVRILGASVTLTSGHVALVWHGHGVATALLSYASNGLRVVKVGSTVGDWGSYTVAGNDVPPFPYGKWVNSPVDFSLTPDATNGTPPSGNTSIFGIGSMCQLSQTVAKGQPHVCDIIRYGRAEARINGGTTPDAPATFAGFAAQNDTSTNRWGLIQSTTGGFLWKGLMTLGYTSVVDFRDSNVNVFIQDCRKVSSGFNKIEIRQASSRVDWTNITFVNASPSTTASKGSLEVIDNADVNIDACTFVDMNTFVFLANSSVLKSTFRRTALITPNGCTFEDNLIDKNTASIALTSTGANLANLKRCTFLSDGTGHGIEITGAAGTFSLIGNIFTGYAASNGSTGNEAIYVNIASGSVTLNVTSGGSTPTIRTAGATVTVNNNIAVTLTGMKDNTEVRVYAAGTTTPELAGIEDATSGSTNNRSFTFSLTGGTSIDIRIYAVGYQPADILTYTVPGSDTSIPIQQVADRWYTNP